MRMPVHAGWLYACMIASGAACASSARPVPRVVVRHQAASHEATRLETPAPPEPPVGTPPDLFVRCEDRSHCPNAVGMLVVDDDAGVEPERCTATLIDRDRVLTVSHCLSPSERHAGAACARTWIAFPETEDAPAEWIACARVVTATESVNRDGLHQEHAVLQLVHASTRAPLAIDPSPPAPGSIVTVVSVTPHPVYGSTHALATRLCRAIDSTPAQQALGDAAANVGWLASCPIEHGNSGSPVLDYDGRIRAIVHGGTSISSAFGVTSGVTATAK